MKKVYKIYRKEYRSWSGINGSYEEGVLLKIIKLEDFIDTFDSEEEAIKYLDGNFTRLPRNYYDFVILPVIEF